MPLKKKKKCKSKNNKIKRPTPSLDDFPLTQPSESNDMAPVKKKKKQKNDSAVWPWFVRHENWACCTVLVADDNGVMTTCNKRLVHRTRSSTSGMKRHLERKHPTEWLYASGPCTLYCSLFVYQRSKHWPWF